MPKQTYFNLPDEKRERFLEAAIDEFADNDYAQASISRLCKTAGIAKGSFYQYFSGKKDLFFYLIELGAEEKQALMAQIDIPHPEEGLFHRLRWLFRLQVKFQLHHPRLAEVGYRAIFREQPFKSQMLAQLKKQAEAGYRQMVLDGITDGSVDPEIDIDTAVFLLNQVLSELGRHLQQRLDLDGEQLMKRQFTDAEWAQANEIFDHLLDMLARGIGPREVNA